MKKLELPWKVKITSHPKPSELKKIFLDNLVIAIGPVKWLKNTSRRLFRRKKKMSSPKKLLVKWLLLMIRLKKAKKLKS